MRTNVTVSLDTELLREAKVLAARRGTSVSSLLADELERLVRQENSYDQAKQRALERLATGYDLGWVRPRTRDELHER
jgi:hypothetical protein